MAATLVFDLETVPDVAGLRRLNRLPQEMPDEEVAQFAFAQRREKTGSDFLPLHLHRVIAIGYLFRDGDSVRVGCLPEPADPHESGQPDEARQIQQFFRLVERYTPQLVSWNGSGFDLQVLHYRGLIHGVQAARYWEQGETDREFRFDNYLSRYHARHLDLMDLLALYNGRANAPLDQLAQLCGFPGKLGMDGSQVWPAFREGRLAEIRAYCETDVANTWLVFCRFQRMRGVWSLERYREEMALLRRTLAAQGGTHWKEFLDEWREDPAA